MAALRRRKSRAWGPGIGFVVAGLIWVGPPGGPAAGADAPPPRSVPAAAPRTLGEVLKRIAARTGYGVRLAPEWADEAVPAEPQEADLLPALREVLAGFNYYTRWDEEHRVITVRILGRVGAASPAPAVREPPARGGPGEAEPVRSNVTIVGGRGATEEEPPPEAVPAPPEAAGAREEPAGGQEEGEPPGTEPAPPGQE